MAISFSLLSSITVFSDSFVDLPYASGQFEKATSGLEGRPLTLLYSAASYSMIREEPRITIALQLREDQQEPVRFVTYAMNITKVGDEEALLRYDAFHTESGFLLLDIIHREGETQVFATREDILNAWKVNPETGPITINMPLESNSTYLMHIDIIGVDSVRTLLPPDQVPSVDIYFNVNDSDFEKFRVYPGELVVVPEFPYHVLLIASVVIGSIIGINRTGLLARFYPDGK